MRLQDVMTEEVRTIGPSAPAEDAWNVMRLHRIHHLVVAREGRVVGILSERDTGGRRDAVVRKNHAVSDLMTAPVVTASATMTVRQAANVMRGRSIGCLVVVKAGRPIGIVTVADLLELIGRGFDRGLAVNTRRALNHRAPHKKAHAAVPAW